MKLNLKQELLKLKEKGPEARLIYNLLGSPENNPFSMGNDNTPVILTQVSRGYVYKDLFITLDGVVVPLSLTIPTNEHKERNEEMCDLLCTLKTLYPKE